MLSYVALGLLFFVALVLFYGIIAIHDIPYDIAKSRNHPTRMRSTWRAGSVFSLCM